MNVTLNLPKRVRKLNKMIAVDTEAKDWKQNKELSDETAKTGLCGGYLKQETY